MVGLREEFSSLVMLSPPKVLQKYPVRVISLLLIHRLVVCPGARKAGETDWGLHRQTELNVKVSVSDRNKQALHVTARGFCRHFAR